MEYKKYLPSRRPEAGEGIRLMSISVSHPFIPRVLGSKCPMPNTKCLIWLSNFHLFLSIWSLSGSLASLSLMSEGVLAPSPSVCCAPCVLFPLLCEVHVVARELSLAHSHGLCGVWLHAMLGFGRGSHFRGPQLWQSVTHTLRSHPAKLGRQRPKRLRGQKTYKSFSSHHSHLSVPPSYHTVNPTHLIAQTIQPIK